MLANKKLIMSTCTLVVMLFGSFLFIQNNDSQTVSLKPTEIEIKAPQVVEEKLKPKEEIEQPKQTIDTSKEVKNEVDDVKTQKMKIIESKDGQHIREDGWIVKNINPLSNPDYILHDLSGYKIGAYEIQVDDINFNHINRDNLISELEKFVPYSVKHNSPDNKLDFIGFYEIQFVVNNTFNDIYELEEYLKTVDFIKFYAKSFQILPEYKNRPDLILNKTIEP